MGHYRKVHFGQPQLYIGSARLKMFELIGTAASKAEDNITDDDWTDKNKMSSGIDDFFDAMLVPDLFQSKLSEVK